MALPWDHRFGRAHLHVPSFGHHPLRLIARRDRELAEFFGPPGSAESLDHQSI